MFTLMEEVAKEKNEITHELFFKDKDDDMLKCQINPQSHPFDFQCIHSIMSQKFL